MKTFSGPKWRAVALSFGVVLSLVLWFLQLLGEDNKISRRQAIAYILRALGNRRDVYRRLPPATHRDELGRPLSSWRLVLRPYVEQIGRPMERHDLPWFAPENLGWFTTWYGKLFTLDSRVDPAGPCEARLVALTGPGTAFSDDYGFAGKLPADLIILIEIADSEWAWSQPGDLDIRNVPASITQGLEGDGVRVGFRDGAVWYLDSSVPLETLKTFFTIEGAQSHDRDRDLGPFRRD